MTSREDVDTPPPPHNGGELAAMSGGERTSREVVQMTPTTHNSSERAKQGGGEGGGEDGGEGGGEGGGEVIYIPLHVIERIMVKLPDKSLARFQCVSKGWLNTVISNPELSHRCTRLPPLLLSVEYKDKMVDLHAYSVDARRNVISWENKAIMHRRFPRPNHYSDSVCNVYMEIGCVTTERLIYMFNMIRGESYEIPTPENVSSRDRKCTVIGKNALTNEINVVVFCQRSVQLCKVVLGNLQLSTWTHISSWPAFVPFGRGLHIGGTLYWIGLEEDRATKKLLGSFNLGTESFSAITLPPPHQFGEDYVIDMQGSLALVRILHGRPLDTLGIWKLNGSQWIQVFFEDMDLDTTMIPVFVWGQKMIIESGVPGKRGRWLCCLDLSTLALRALYRIGALCSVFAMDASTLSPALLRHG